MFFYETSQPWVSKNISDDAILEGQKKYLNTLYNTYSFYVLYANIDNFDATKYSYDYKNLKPMDKWLLSKLNTLIADVTDGLDKYDIVSPSRAIEEFVDELSNWYVRRSRERFWAKGMEQDKIDAYLVLYETLVKLSKVIAPFSPFIAEEIYKNLVCSLDKNAKESVHLCDYPISETDKIDKDLERDMEEVLEIVTLGRSVRALKTIKNRQPLSKMYVIGAPSLNEYYASVIEDELNVKEIEYTSDLEKFVNYSLKLNFRSLGPKVGKNIGLVKNALSEMDQAKAYKEFKTNGKLKVLDYELDENDLIVETHEASDYASISDSKITVVLDTNLTEELIDEGYVREVVSKIQTERKEAGFEVVDHITLSFEGDEKLLDIIKKYESKIASQTLADKVLYNESLGYSKDWEISPYNLKISVKKV